MPEQRVYANRAHLSCLKDPCLNDLCRAIWSEEPQELQLQHYGSRARFFKAVDAPEEASLWLLPLLWNDYLEQDLIALVEEEALRAAQMGRRLMVFSQGDFPAHLPITDGILFERSSYASRRDKGGNDVYALPAFIPDYLKLYCHGQVQLREKGASPVVGFCGQAGGSPLDLTQRELMTRLRKMSYRMGWRKWEPAPYEVTRLRSRILEQVRRCPGLQTSFLTRSRYRAGYMPAEKDPFHPTRLEFIQNILGSDFTVCVRGNGNFSVRFYETLALGRIPVFINTDCLLPFDDLVDYRQYCVWVEEDEIPSIGEKVLDFYETLSPSQFKELQAACSILWRERLSMDGFYATLAGEFPIPNLAQLDT
jgi:hypothetical protein